MSDHLKNAYNALVDYVNDSVDFADAECRISREFHLTEDELAQIRSWYDDPDDYLPNA